MASIPSPERLLRTVFERAGTGVRLAREQAEAVAALPAALMSLTRAVGSLDVTIHEAQATVVRMQRVGERLESILDEVEQPTKDLAPGLRRLGEVFDDPAVSDLPDTVRRLRDDMLPLVASLRGGAEMLDRFAGARSLLGGFRRLPPEPGQTPTIVDTARRPEPTQTPPILDDQNAAGPPADTQIPPTVDNHDAASPPEPVQTPPTVDDQNAAGPPQDTPAVAEGRASAGPAGPPGGPPVAEGDSV